MKLRAFLTLPVIGAIVGVAKRCFGGCTGRLTVECPTATDWIKAEPSSSRPDAPEGRVAVFHGDDVKAYRYGNRWVFRKDGD